MASSVKRRGTIVTVPYHHMATDWGGPIDDSDDPASPCPPPSINDLRERFPEFAGYSDVQIADAINDASCWADTSWANNCGDCTKAILFLAAHYLALQAIATSQLPDTVPDGSGGVTFVEGGAVTSIAFETMRVGFAAPSAVAGNSNRLGEGGRYDLNSTPYGQRYLDLLKVNQPAILVI